MSVSSYDYLSAHLICTIDEISDLPSIVARNVMLRVAGNRFRCSCGCNVFHRYSDGTYGCNACDLIYESQ